MAEQRDKSQYFAMLQQVLGTDELNAYLNKFRIELDPHFASFIGRSVISPKLWSLLSLALLLFCWDLHCVNLCIFYFFFHFFFKIFLVVPEISFSLCLIVDIAGSRGQNSLMLTTNI